MRSGRTAGLGVRTRSGSDGIDHASCALIRSLPLAVLTRDATAGGSVPLSPISGLRFLIDACLSSDESLRYFRSSALADSSLATIKHLLLYSRISHGC